MAKKVQDPELEVASPGFVEEFCTKPYVDDDGVQVTSGIGRDGKEYPDPVPMSPPVGYNAPPDLMTMIRQMVHHEANQRLADEQGFDSFDEAGDFDVEDDPLEPLSPWEAILQTPPSGNRPQEAAPKPPASDATSPPKVAAPSEAGVASPPPGTPTPPNSTST